MSFKDCSKRNFHAQLGGAYALYTISCFVVSGLIFVFLDATATEVPSLAAKILFC